MSELRQLRNDLKTLMYKYEQARVEIAELRQARLTINAIVDVTENPPQKLAVVKTYMTNTGVIVEVHR